ncbi:hypothetical protein ISS07_06350 [Candidatus Woesearchaeota archaeon]|nr:hypothetical protein [Candidatus Woesearchaeota archaeon]
MKYRESLCARAALALVLGFSSESLAANNKVSDLGDLVNNHEHQSTDHSLSLLMQKTEFIGKEKYTERAKEILEDSIKFLMSEFGTTPLNTGNVRINVSDSAHGEVNLIPYSDGSRTMLVSPIYLAEGQEHYFVHEIFHGYFQSDHMMRTMSDLDIERWATYAQYRYKYKSFSNDEIAQRISSDYAVALGDVEKLTAKKSIDRNLPKREIRKIYIAGALTLFSRSHHENFTRYQKLIGMSDQKVTP